MRTDFLFNEFLLHTLKELSQNKFLKTFIDEFLLGDQKFQNKFAKEISSRINIIPTIHTYSRDIFKEDQAYEVIVLAPFHPIMLR